MNREEALDPREREELDRLAAELRAAHPPEPLSADFVDRVHERAQRRWSLRGAMHRNPLMRVAAALLLVSVVGAPVAALIQVWQGGGASRPLIGLDEPLLPEVEQSEREPMPDVVPPVPAWDDEDLGPEGARALERTNRLRLAVASWETAGDAPAATGLPAAPRRWSEATPEQLWGAFVRRLAAGDTGRVPEPLAARVRALWQDGDAPTRNALAGWHWVLTGTDSGAPQPRAWSGAPYAGD